MTAPSLDAALAAATSNRRQCTCRTRGPRVDHVTRDDVTEARRATEGELRVKLAGLLREWEDGERTYFAVAEDVVDTVQMLLDVGQN